MVEESTAPGCRVSLKGPEMGADVTGPSRERSSEFSRHHSLTLADPDCDMHDREPSKCACRIDSGPRGRGKAGEDGQQPLLSVADVRRATGVTRKALLVYEGRGLVSPVQRTKAGYRLYDDEALRRIALVRRAKALGLTLAEAAEFIDMVEGCCAQDQGDLAMLLSRRIEQTEQLIQKLFRRRDELCEVLKALAEPHEGSLMSCRRAVERARPVAT